MKNPTKISGVENKIKSAQKYKLCPTKSIQLIQKQ